MILVGREKLTQFTKRHARALTPIQAWLVETTNARWQTPQDIRNRFRSADFRPDNRVIFNIGGNNFRLVVKVRYRGDLAEVEWVGTHAEYDRMKF